MDMRVLTAVKKDIVDKAIIENRTDLVSYFGGEELWSSTIQA